MESRVSDGKASAATILDYWIDIESMAPETTPPGPNLDPKDVRAGNRLMEPTDLEKLAESNKRGVRLALGIFRMGDANRSVISRLGAPEPGIGWRQTQDDDDLGHLATVDIDPASGSYFSRSLQPTIFALRHPVIGAERPEQGDLKVAADGLRTLVESEVFRTTGRDGDRVPFGWSSLLMVSELLRRESGLEVRNGATLPIAVVVACWEKDEVPPPVSFDRLLHEDLERVRASVDVGLGAVLERYLWPASNHVDIERDGLIELLRPGSIPPGKWPGRGESGPPLVIRQQAAVHAARLDGNPLCAVNGPPGTGKTTLLKDVVAAAYVDRAIALAGFEDPMSAFGRSASIVEEGMSFTVHRLDDTLRGRGILVAAANNTAVENITKELPLRASIAPDLCDNAMPDLFRDIAQAVSSGGRGGPAWGTFAAALGSRKNVSTFLKHYWGTKSKRSLAFKRGAIVTAFKRKEGGALGICFDKVLWLNLDKEEAEAFGDPEKGRRYDILYEKGCPQPEVVKALSPDESRDPIIAYLAAPRTKVDWGHARADFLSALERVELLKGKLCKLDERPRVERDAAAALSVAVSDRDAAARDRRAAQVRSAMVDGRLRDLAGKLQTIERSIDLHLATRPRGLSSMFSPQRRRDWQSAMEGMKKRRMELVAERERADAGAAAEAVRMAEAARLEALSDIGIAEAKRVASECELQFLEIDASFAQGPLRPSQAMELEPEHREKTSPWLVTELDQARERVFTAAVRLHVAFAQAAGDAMADNLRAFVYLQRRRELSTEPGRSEFASFAGDLWDTFFLTVPVVSSTFASVGGMFGDAMGKESLGWVLVDEAGQATPQAAAGSLWRARRSVVVGDPFQVAPIHKVADTVAQRLRELHGLHLSGSAATATSAQAAADAGSIHGTVMNGVWVGAPLRVHRRCSSPMFQISNAVSYGDAMVQGKASPDTASWRGELPTYGLGGKPSSWIDVPDPGSSIGKWNPAEGAAVKDVVKTAFRELSLANAVTDAVGRSESRHWVRDDGMPDLFVISPFREVVEHVRRTLKGIEADVREYVPEGVSYGKWVNQVCGTVHRFQGREAGMVLMVLGCGETERGGMAWAGSQASIVNVAVTRAKWAFHIVGNRKLWERSPSFKVAARFLEHEGWGIRVLEDQPLAKGNKISRISTLDDHLGALSEALETSRRRVDILSPYLRMNALKPDPRCELIELVRRCVSDKGVTVTVYCDCASWEKEPHSSDQAVEALRAAGAYVEVREGLHSKAMVIDDETVFEGSFNWLSAARKGKWMKYESTFRLDGPQAAEFAAKVRTDLKELPPARRVPRPRTVSYGSDKAQRSNPSGGRYGADRPQGF